MLPVENGVCMVNEPMTLFAGRFRPAFAEALRAAKSKAPSAASLSSGQFVGCQETGCDLLAAPY
jgi:hypothetical protein